MMSKPPIERAATNPFPEWPKILKVDYGAEESIAKYGHDPRIWETTVKSISSKDGKIKSVTTVEVEFKTIDGKRTLVERAGTEKVLPCDLLLIAAGFVGCEEYTARVFGVDLTERGVVSSTNGYATSKEKIFSAGDMRRGQSLVVWAISEGRECAKQIDKYLLEKA